MKLGLITDIHNDAVRLRRALELLSDRKVDRIVTIGDTFDPMVEPEGIEEITRLLVAHKVIGVWGNHDYGFCREISDFYLERYPAAMFDYLKSIKPSIELGDLHFSHREWFVDPFDPIAMWDLTGEKIDNTQQAIRALQVDRYWLQFVGHYHDWMAFNRSGQLDWNGQQPLRFEADQRYYIVVAAVCDGWCGLLDTDQRSLDPIPL